MEQIQLEELIALLEAQNERIRGLERRMEAMEMSDPFTVKSLYENLIVSDCSLKIDSCDFGDSEESRLRSFSKEDSSDFIHATNFSPSISLVGNLSESSYSPSKGKTTDRPLRRYSRDELLEIGVRRMAQTGQPKKLSTVQVVPRFSSSSEGTNAENSLRVTIDNPQSSLSNLSLSNSIDASSSIDTPRKSFRQILQSYSADSEKSAQSDTTELMHSRDTTLPSGTNRGIENIHRHSDRNCNTTKGGHRVVIMDNRGSNQGRGYSSYQTRQRSRQSKQFQKSNSSSPSSSFYNSTKTNATTFKTPETSPADVNRLVNIGNRFGMLVRPPGEINEDNGQDEFRHSA